MTTPYREAPNLNPAKPSLWTRFKAWFLDPKTWESSMSQTIREMHEERAREAPRKAAQAILDDQRKEFNRIAEATYIQYVVMHPDEPDVHTKAYSVALKAAQGWQNKSGEITPPTFSLMTPTRVRLEDEGTNNAETSEVSVDAHGDGLPNRNAQTKTLVT